MHTYKYKHTRRIQTEPLKPPNNTKDPLERKTNKAGPGVHRLPRDLVAIKSSTEANFREENSAGQVIPRSKKSP